MLMLLVTRVEYVIWSIILLYGMTLLTFFFGPVVEADHLKISSRLWFMTC